jgi:hypothetical protein
MDNRAGLGCRWRYGSVKVIVKLHYNNYNNFTAITTSVLTCKTSRNFAEELVTVVEVETQCLASPAIITTVGINISSGRA